ncbi:MULTISPECIES: NAD(P)H-binding protein [Cyanophyceae]|uniref:NAD(P)H-binding protein n=1 Tax=Cyanophyceae TaxID=3028117 RepID=UPI001685DBBE|nr:MULTISPECIES: NAD(P)H-binding protein [unclassified Phormidium]MBD1918931.1 SDR family oxidoreductase [Phormidium sp. FACHB-77]MBD2033227.1 SDR family oxidoreductase [Phormidium sp. FACHB-322]MBD2053840.1 SDR family oxidoreductase [Leptolyngbya sp. FACHB-60]
MKAFVAGATGATGSKIVNQLVGRGVPVVAFVRDAAAAREKLPIEVTLMEGSVTDKESIRKAIAGCTVLLSATGARPGFDPTGPYQVDYEGNKNLIDVAKETGIEHFVMVSSLCASRFFHPLNLFFLILYWKHQAEAYLQASGLTYTIVRPGGLKDDDTDTRTLVMAPADTLSEGSVTRQKVAEVCVEALYLPQSRNKIVEIVAQDNANPQPYEAMFAAVA